MASASDKARFYLEQSIPELKEWERKKVFLQNEISSIISKRSDFEHKVNARGSKPSDYVKYVEFEINVDTLRKKRVKRLGVKSVAHSGQRRIFHLFDRATKKFPGDVGLWMQYLEYARRQKALKKLVQILTTTLRLHPQKPELWIYAARFSLEENADIQEARSYMQRGLRFCKSSRIMWLEYTKLELLYISKITARRQILGIDNNIARESSPEAGFDADVIKLPKLTQEDVDPQEHASTDLDGVLLSKLQQSRALTGAVPIAIFDSAMKQFDHEELLAKSFYDLTQGFSNIGCLNTILDHMVQEMLSSHPGGPLTMICHIKVAIAGISMDSPDFPPALGIALSRLRQHLHQSKWDTANVIELKEWLEGMRQNEDLDPALSQVLFSMLSMLENIGDQLAADNGSLALEG